MFLTSAVENKPAKPRFFCCAQPQAGWFFKSAGYFLGSCENPKFAFPYHNNHNNCNACYKMSKGVRVTDARYIAV